MYYEYPLYLDVDDIMVVPKLLIISPFAGLFVVNCSPEIDEEMIQHLDDETSQIENYLFSKMVKSNSTLLKKSKRELSFELQSLLYLPLLAGSKVKMLSTDNQIVCDKDEILKIITEKNCCITSEMQNEICAILEGSKVILKPKKRTIEIEDESSKGYILKKIEEQIAILDLDQKNAALAQITGPQRIRGLAGSGKTIILCMKAALIHLRNPEKRILYTFTTKSLYDYIETLIIRFYRFFGDGNLPDFDNIQIKHSWGGSNVSGVYYTCCRNNGIVPLTFEEAKQSFSTDPFDYACQDLLEKTSGKLKTEYDYVLIDEAQDFRPSFYQLCRAIVKDDCLVWCYDDLQNIFDVKIQDTIATFENKYGAKGINLEELNEQHEDLNNDIVLAKTYRNPLEILVLAHAVGFGIYNDSLIQTLENKQHWHDFGYDVLSGDCKIGDNMVIVRPKENSPSIISEMQTVKDIIEVNSFADPEEEIEWVVSSIQNSIENEKLLPEDIIVITLDDKNSKIQLKMIADKLRNKGIESFNLTDRSYSKGFFEEKCVTLSTVYRAKGNEAAQVYVIGVQVFESNANRRSMRNRAFTAFTRAKGWLKISGVNISGGKLCTEIEHVITNGFKLKFIQTEPKYIIEMSKAKNKTKKQVKKHLDELKKLDLTKEEILALLQEQSGI
jgi:superfamily I DNA and RNA helicase